MPDLSFNVDGDDNVFRDDDVFVKLSERQTEDFCVTDRLDNVKGEFERLAAGEFD